MSVTLDQLQKITFITKKVAGKGATFLGFNYPDSKTGAIRRRNVTINANIPNGLQKRGKPLNGGGNWGKSLDNVFVAYNDQIYIQGFPNNDKEGNTFKRFSLDKMTDLS